MRGVRVWDLGFEVQGLGRRVYGRELGVGVVELGVGLGQEDALGLDHLRRFRVVIFQFRVLKVTSLGFTGRPGPFFSLKIGSAYIKCRHRLAYFLGSLPVLSFGSFRIKFLLT